MHEPLKLLVNEQDEVDVDAIMRQIREYILARKAAAGGTAGPLPRFEGRFDPMVYEHLYHAAMLHDQLHVTPLVRTSRAPIIGPLLTALRRKLHELTLFYVYQLAQKQITVNTHLLGAMNALVRDMEDAPQAEETQREIEALRQRLEAIEGRQ